MVGEGAALPPASTLPEDGGKALYRSGLSTFAEGGGPYLDGRVVRVVPGVASNVPHCAHGWLSNDTKVLLSAAIAACKPRALLELGAWYGLSSRHIMTRAAEEGIPRMQFFSVDYFKNTAHYDRWVDVCITEWGVGCGVCGQLWPWWVAVECGLVWGAAGCGRIVEAGCVYV
jgi:hypothetical protein